MPRPQNERLVHEPPIFTEFKPIGVKSQALEEVSLSLDEFEAFRLADMIGLTHAEAADEMEISRPTFSRMIDKARSKLADFIINGRLLSIGGGNIHFKNNLIRCQNCNHMFKISFKDVLSECPSCHSDNLINLAGGFGHGQCCNLRQHKTRE